MAYMEATGKQLIRRLEELGIIPEGVATKVIIEADYRDVVRIHYATIAQTKLLEIEAADVMPARIVEHK